MNNIKPRTKRRLQILSRRGFPLLIWLSLAAFFIYSVVFGSFQNWYILFSVVVLVMFTPMLGDCVTTNAKRNLYRDK